MRKQAFRLYGLYTYVRQGTQKCVDFSCFFAFFAVWLLGCFSNRFFVDFGIILDSFWGGFGTSKALKIDVGLGLKTGTRQSRPGILEYAAHRQMLRLLPPRKGHSKECPRTWEPGFQGLEDWLPII